MANILSLAVKITGDSSGLRLTGAERAFRQLGVEAEKITSIFDEFTAESEAAQRAQQKFATDLAFLASAAKTGQVGAEQLAEEFKNLAEAANAESAALRRAAQITEANLTPLERYDQALTELNAQVEAGRISQETYNRATERAAKGLTDAERASRGLAVQQKEIETAATNTTLKFNELSGVFSALPGPLGNIAGRISGLASAGEGLSRIFAGGLTQGISSLGASVAALVNPFTLAVAGIAAFGAATVSVARGLIDLEDRVERLNRLATQLGVSFEFVQTLEEAGRRADVSIEQLSGSFARLQNTLAGADEESKKAQAALQRLGLSVSEFAALSEEQRIDVIGERLAQIEDPAQRSAAAIALFGRSGVQLLPFFNELELAASDMERLGRAVTSLEQQRLSEFGAAIDELFVATQGLGQALLLPFTGLGEGVASAAADFVSAITAIADTVGRILAPAFDQIGAIVDAVGAGIGTLAPVFRTLASVIEPIGQFLLPAVVAQMVALNRVAIAGAITSLARVFSAAAAAAVAYATSAGTAAAATLALGTAVRALMASTGIGALVVGIGLAANALIDWFSTADDVSEGMNTTADSAKRAADESARLAEELAKEDAALAQTAAKAIDDVRGKLSQAIDASQQFGQAGFDAAVQYQSAINDLQAQFDRGILNEEAFRREAEKAERAYAAQIDTIKKAAAETEAITQRVDGLLAKANELPQVQQDLNAIEAEIARVEAEIVAARAADEAERATQLAGRLSQLDQLQAGLEDQADQAAQGFTQGFDAAFASVDDGFNKLSQKAEEFGQQGFDAALLLKQGIEQAQEQVRDGILTKEAFYNEVERQQKLFEQRIDQLKQAEKLAGQASEKEAQLRDRQFEIELDRARELATARTGSIEINDLREGGISAFFDTLQEDSAIAEARKQRQELEKIRKEIAKLNAEKVDILGGTG